MASIRKVKKRLKRQLKEAYKAKRFINKEHMASRTAQSLFNVVSIRSLIEVLEQELLKLNEL